MDYDEDIQVGDRVVRGPRWKWGNQDVDPRTREQTEGVVKQKNNCDLFPYYVCWDGGHQDDYRAGDITKAIKIDYSNLWE